MRNVRTPRIILILLSSLFFMSVTRAPAQEVQKGPMVIYEERHDTSPPMREMPSRAPQPGARGMALSLRRPGLARVDISIDTALQQSSPAAQVGTTNGLNFDGVSDRDGVAPPDTNASVGASQVVETVNFSYQVFDKATGATVFGSDLNDYTKIGVWRDAYYLAANIFPFGGSFIGPQVCALKRTAMLAGSAA